MALGMGLARDHGMVIERDHGMVIETDHGMANAMERLWAPVKDFGSVRATVIAKEPTRAMLLVKLMA